MEDRRRPHPWVNLLTEVRRFVDTVVLRRPHRPRLVPVDTPGRNKIRVWQLR